MNASSQFRSHLMQQLAGNARAQSRPPIALFSFVSERRALPTRTAGYSSQPANSSISHRQPPSLSTISSSHGVLPTITSPSHTTHQRPSSSASVTNSFLNDGDSSATPSDIITQHINIASSVQHFQQLIASRRTVSNFVSHPLLQLQQLSNEQFVRDAISRGVSCAVAAPNHKLTEPTTLHCISSPSAASERLLNIAYEVALQMLLDNKLSGIEACWSGKREKWAMVPAFVVATVSGMGDETSTTDADAAGRDSYCNYKELPYVPKGSLLERRSSTVISICVSGDKIIVNMY